MLALGPLSDLMHVFEAIKSYGGITRICFYISLGTLVRGLNEATFELLRCLALNLVLQL